MDSKKNDSKQQKAEITGRTWIDIVVLLTSAIRRRIGNVRAIAAFGLLTVGFAIGVVREHHLTDPGSKVSFIGIEWYTKARSTANSVVRISEVQKKDDYMIEVYSREIDREVVMDTLKSLEIDISLKTPNRNIADDHRTNAIWYGSSVPREFAVAVATELSRNGVDISQIRPFSDSNGKEMKIHVGTKLYIE